MDREPIHYLPLSEQRYARIIQILEQHPARNLWSRADRMNLGSDIMALANSANEGGPGTDQITMAANQLLEVADWLPGAVGFSPPDLIDLLRSYVQPA